MLLARHHHTKSAARDKHHHLIDAIADVNAVVNGLSLFPQVYLAWISQDLSGISLPTFAITGCAQIVWQIYGWHRRAYPVIISSGLVGVCAFTIVFLVLASRPY